MKRLLLLPLAALAFAGCSDENTYLVMKGEQALTFEGAPLGDDGFIWGKSFAWTVGESDPEARYVGAGSKFFFGPLYTEGDASIYSFYTDYAGLFDPSDVWNGIIPSQLTDRTTPGFANDKSVYASGGAHASARFGIVYYGAWTPEPYGVPVVRFAGGVKPVSVEVAATTYFYLYFKGGTNPAAPVDVEAVFTGYNNGFETGRVAYKLAEASGAVPEGWQRVDLGGLGTVTEIRMTMETTDEMCPAYFAIDDLTYVE